MKNLPDTIFKEERIKLLNQFLERKNIYQTEEFQEKYEAQARKNIKREINMLENGKSSNI